MCKERTLANELLLKLVEELEGELVLGRERLLADDGFHGRGVTADGVFRVLRIKSVSDGRWRAGGEY